MQEPKHKNKPTKQSAVAAILKAVVVAVLVLIVPLVNYNIDPSRLYHTGREDSLELNAVDILLNGQNAAHLSNCNERLLKREFLRRTEEQYETVVLGSSRGAMITGEMLGEESFYNLSLAGASLEDILGIYGYMLMNGQSPERVVISIDPWLANDNFTDPRSWNAYGDGYLYVVNELLGGNDTRVYEPYGLFDPESDGSTFWELDGATKLNLFSIPYFQNCLRELVTGNYAIYSEVVPTDEAEGETGIMHTDGSFSYPAAYRNAPDYEIINKVQLSFPESVLGMEDYTVLKGEKYALLEQFIALLTSQGVEIQFILQPISPLIIDHMQTEPRYANFFLTEEMYYELAAQYDIDVVGTFDPYEMMLSFGSFYDGYHMRPRFITPLIEELNALSEVTE